MNLLIPSSAEISPAAFMATLVEGAMSIASTLVAWLMTATALLGFRFLALLVELLEKVVLTHFLNGHVERVETGLFPLRLDAGKGDCC